jgi:hypothetical protein
MTMSWPRVSRRARNSSRRDIRARTPRVGQDGSERSHPSEATFIYSSECGETSWDASTQGAPTPRARLEAASLRIGRDAVVEGCIALLAGDEVTPALVITLGGAHAQDLLNRGVPAHQA